MSILLLMSNKENICKSEHKDIRVDKFVLQDVRRRGIMERSVLYHALKIVRRIAATSWRGIV